jgi:hypothetical protein
VAGMGVAVGGAGGVVGPGVAVGGGGNGVAVGGTGVVVGGTGVAVGVGVGGKEGAAQSTFTISPPEDPLLIQALAIRVA